MRTIDYFMILCSYPFLYVRHTLSVISDLFIHKVKKGTVEFSWEISWCLHWIFLAT